MRIKFNIHFRNFVSILALFLGLLPSALAIPFSGHKYVATVVSPEAIEAAKDIGAAGGNVVDMAVAMALTLSVTQPYYASFGGGGFALLSLGNGPVKALDFREVAPLRATPGMYLKNPSASENGALASGVPGIPMGLWELYQSHGSKKVSWARLFEIALKKAVNGFPVSGEWVDVTNRNRVRFNSHGLRYLSKENGSALLPGEILRQPQFAKFLKLYSQRGAKAFYEGEGAADISKSLAAVGGILSAEDFKKYRAVWRKATVTSFLGHEVYTMSLPSSAELVIPSALKLLELTGISKAKPLSSEEFHFMGEVLKMSYSGRSELGDPDFSKNPVNFLTQDSHLKSLANKISAKQVAKIESVPNWKEGTQTTHLTVMAANGDAIAMTLTVNSGYGSGVLTEKYGITMNNEMDDFTTQTGANQYGLIQGKANEIIPGKRPLSSMSPTIVKKDGRVVMALGAPGGPRILSGVIQTLYRTIALGWDIDSAIQAPRVHHQFAPNVLYYEGQKFSPDVIQTLNKLGHKTESSWMGRVNGVKWDPKKGLEGAFDSRGEGAAGGI